MPRSAGAVPATMKTASGHLIATWTLVAALPPGPFFAM
jgi:hypothetical protein